MDVYQHLIDRGMNPNLYHCSWDDEVACFLLPNLSGQLAGLHQYRPFATKTTRNDRHVGRYYQYFTHGHIPWGLECVNLKDEFLFVTEGIFDACKLHNLGLSAIATFTNDPAYLKNWLSIIPCKIVTICDNDEPGKALAKYGNYTFRTSLNDLGDMNETEVKSFVDDILVKIRS